jgi:FkbM family methyltransferase
MVYGDYADPGFWRWARNHVPEDGIVVDSGANIGQFIPYFASILEGGHILAFEPSPYCQKWVHECLDANPCLSVELVSKGLGCEKGAFTLANTGGAHGLWGELGEEEGGQGEEVEVTTLTEAIRKRGIPRVSLWKLDVEGHELEALKGAHELLENGRIDALYVELHAGNEREDVEYLRRHGYSAYDVKRTGELNKVEEPPQDPVDLLFLPQ